MDHHWDSWRPIMRLERFARTTIIEAKNLVVFLASQNQVLNNFLRCGGLSRDKNSRESFFFQGIRRKKGKNRSRPNLGCLTSSMSGRRGRNIGHSSAGTQRQRRFVFLPTQNFFVLLSLNRISQCFCSTVLARLGIKSSPVILSTNHGLGALRGMRSQQNREGTGSGLEKSKSYIFSGLWINQGKVWSGSGMSRSKSRHVGMRFEESGKVGIIPTFTA